MKDRIKPTGVVDCLFEPDNILPITVSLVLWALPFFFRLTPLILRRGWEDKHEPKDWPRDHGKELRLVQGINIRERKIDAQTVNQL